MVKSEDNDFKSNLDNAKLISITNQILLKEHLFRILFYNKLKF